MRWLDDDRASSVKGTTLKEYRRAAAAFVCYLEKHAWWPSGPEEWDDLLVEYAIDEQITPSRFRNTYASIEFLHAELQREVDQFSDSDRHCPVEGAHTAHSSVWARIG